MDVLSVGEPSAREPFLLSIREYTQEKNPLNVLVVGRHSVRTLVLLNTGEFVPGRNLTSISRVVKSSPAGTPTSTSEERNPTNVNVERPSGRLCLAHRHVLILESHPQAFLSHSQATKPYSFRFPSSFVPVHDTSLSCRTQLCYLFL